MKIPNQAARKTAALTRLVALDSPEQPVWFLFGTAVIERDVELAEAILDTYEERLARKKREATR